MALGHRENGGGMQHADEVVCAVCQVARFERAKLPAWEVEHIFKGQSALELKHLGDSLQELCTSAPRAHARWSPWTLMPSSEGPRLLLFLRAPPPTLLTSQPRLPDYGRQQ